MLPSFSIKTYKLATKNAQTFSITSVAFRLDRYSMIAVPTSIIKLLIFYLYYTETLGKN